MKKLAPAAIAMVMSPGEERILLVKRRDFPVWVLPGGAIDAQEAEMAAAVREVQEETGLVVQAQELLAHYTPLNSLAAPTYLIKCHYIDGFLQQSDESADVGFFPWDNLPPFTLPLHKQWIAQARAGLYRGETLPLVGTRWRDALGYLLRHPLLAGRYLASRLWR